MKIRRITFLTIFRIQIMSFLVIKEVQRLIFILQIIQFKLMKVFGRLRVLKKRKVAISRIFGVCPIKYRVMVIMLEYMHTYAW